MGAKSKCRDLWELVRSIPVCMLTTRDGDMLRSRPMATAIDEDKQEFLFLTRASSHKAREIEKGTEVNLAFALHDRDLFISVSGQGRVTKDPETARQLWNPYIATYLPDGPEGEDVAVLRVAPIQAECWFGGRPQKLDIGELEEMIESGSQHDLGTSGQVQS